MSRDATLIDQGPDGSAPGAAVGATRSRPARRRPARLSLVAVAVALLVATAVIVVRGRDDGRPGALAGTAAVDEQQMEARYGARFGVVGLLAAGGLVELRFQVVDKDKAEALFGHDGSETPKLVVADSGKVLETAKGMAHKLTLLDGASYFLLFTNAANAVQEGSTVSVVIGDVRLDDVTVQQ